MVATAPHPRSVPITNPSTSPMAQPVKQCAVALKASLFSDVSVPCIEILLSRKRLLALRVPLPAPPLHLRDLPLLGVYDGPGDLLYLGVRAVLQRHARHVYGRLVVGDHVVDERLVEGVLVRQLLRGHRHAH